MLWAMAINSNARNENFDFADSDVKQPCGVLFFLVIVYFYVLFCSFFIYRISFERYFPLIFDEWTFHVTLKKELYTVKDLSNVKGSN